MATRFTFGFVRQYPAIAIFAKAQQVAALAQLLAWQIVERIHFMGRPGDAFEAGLLQRLDHGRHILNSKFDFNFFCHAEISDAGKL